MPMEQVLLSLHLEIFWSFLHLRLLHLPPAPPAPQCPNTAGGNWRRPCAHDVPWHMLTTGQAEAAASSAEMQS